MELFSSDLHRQRKSIVSSAFKYPKAGLETSASVAEEVQEAQQTSHLTGQVHHEVPFQLLRARAIHRRSSTFLLLSPRVLFSFTPKDNEITAKDDVV
jgi:hypothetical protein